MMDDLLMLRSIGLTLLSQGLMIGSEVLVLLQGLSTLLRRQVGSLLQEVLQDSTFNGDTKMLLFS